MKDLRETYVRQGQRALYEKMLTSSAQWRTEIFQRLSAADVSILVACIEGYSSRKQVLRKTKEALTRFAFNNGLMRFGLYVQQTKAPNACVVMDWPDGNDPKPFNLEYAFAFGKGRTPNNIRYTCGALNHLGFSDAVFFTNMRHSTLLQAADLVVGAVRELLECCLEKRGPGQGVDCLKTVKSKFVGSPNKILGHGLSVSKNNRILFDKVRAGLLKFL
jgi:hypothetical protein